MRKSFLPIVALLLGFFANPATPQTTQATAQGNTGVIEGTITQAGAPEPIPIVVPGVTVQLSTPSQTVLDGVTDEMGHFAFKDLYPGRYQLRFERDEYFPASEGVQGNVEIEVQGEGAARGAFQQGGAGGGSRPGPANRRGVSQILAFTLDVQLPVKLAMQMVPGGVISGQVLDSTGRPLSNESVSALRITYPEGLRTLATGVNTMRITNDRGEYRIFGLEPGEYVVRFDRRRAANAPGTPQETYRWYFPGVDDASRTMPVSVRGGRESNGTNFNIPPTMGVKISGVVVTPKAAGVAPSVSLHLLPRDASVRDSVLTLNPTATADGAGKFEVRNVAPGRYDLYAVVPTNPPGLQRNIGHASINVGNQDQDGISIVVSSGVDLRARFTSKDAGSQSQIPGQLTLRMRDGVSGIQPRPPGGGGGPPGEWRVYTGLTEGRYVLDSQLASLRDAYVADIRQGERSIYETGTILIGNSPPEPVEVILARPAGTIDGTVQNASGKPASGATVILIPNGDRRENPMLYKRAIAGPGGRFTLSALAPGAYKLFAWENIPNGAELNVDFMKAYESRGVPITVEAGAQLKVQLPIIPAGQR